METRYRTEEPDVSIEATIKLPAAAYAAGYQSTICVGLFDFRDADNASESLASTTCLRDHHMVLTADLPRREFGH